MNFRKNYLLLTSYIYFNKITFIRKMAGGKVLDIGCGNHSPTRTKNIKPSIYYVGVDIDKCNLNNADLEIADEIHFFDVASFFDDIIKKIDHNFDYIICAHVIEHLPDKDLLFKTIKNKLTKGGKCFITTPNIKSINFPPSGLTLNYYDDKTHVEMPVTFQHVYDLCTKYDLRLTTFRLQNRTILSYLIGLCFEPLRMIFKRNFPFTWCYWGFEDLYIIEKN
ncbi:MAG TPA: class I SAM-dependent methyltransferase [Mucilaginibacter sp.]